MTVRQSLGPRADEVHERLDQVLDGEDGIILLMDRNGATTFCHGFGASGCQLELLWHQIDRALRELIHGAGRDARGIAPAVPARAEC